MAPENKEHKKTQEIDSLDTLSLSAIPFSSHMLKQGKLIKNARLETAFELHSDPIAGSLHIDPADIENIISISARDKEIIGQLASMPSYDIYSLRNSLKKMGIELEGEETLDLPEDIKKRLLEMNTRFTRPLIEKIFGDKNAASQNTGDLQKLFRDPDINRVRKNLHTISEQTGIHLNDIPKFLEDYSEVFLSVAYYENIFTGYAPDIDRFSRWIRELLNHRDVASTPKTANSCKKVEDSFSFLANSLRERFARFERSFEDFWVNINKESFRQLRFQVEENHSSMGSALCGLGLKIHEWAKEFPENSMGGPTTRAKYVVSELEPGLDHIVKIETAARKKITKQL